MMTNATIPMGGRAVTSPISLSWHFIRWGLGLFLTGFLTGFVPIGHYMVGAIAGGVGPDFLRNITLWWGCPAVLAELTLKTGGLGMIAIGFCYQAVARQDASLELSSRERIAPTLCSCGLIATLVTASAGYVICNYFWPNFYYHAIPAGKNVWLAAQGLSIAVYVVGVCYAFAGIRRASANTVHLMIWMAFCRLKGGAGLSVFRRMGKLLIFRLTPRLLRRPSRGGRRSWRISSSTAWWNALR